MLYSTNWDANSVKSQQSRCRDALCHIDRKTHCNYYLDASQHMINIEISQIMKLVKRFQTLQKWVKSKAYCRRYCTLKFIAHQIQRKMFFVFVAVSIVLCSINSRVRFEMISSFRNRTQNKCENDSLSVFVISQLHV